MAKLLKSGKIAIKLSPEAQSILRRAVQIRLEMDELPHYLEYLLQEALERLQGDQCKLRKSEFFALFQEDNMIYIDEPTQLLLRDAAQLEGQTVLASTPTASTPFIAPTLYENIEL